MRRLPWLLLVSVGMINCWGCGSGEPALPPIPTVDNRPAEVKEADDMMLKNVQRINAASKKR
jgi:hypothetical protein